MREGEPQFIWFKGGFATLKHAWYLRTSKPRYVYHYITGAA